MGWTNNDGMVPKKPVEEKKTKFNQWKEEDIIDLADVHEQLNKTDVKKELANCCTKGIEMKRSIEVLSDRKAAKLRKVNIFIRNINYFAAFAIVIAIPCDRIFNDEIFDS